MLITKHLTILQYNLRKSSKGIMILLFKNQAIENIDILAI